MVLMLGVARALRGMHQYRMPKGLGQPASNAKGKARAVREEAAEADRDAARRAGKSQKQKRREMVAQPPGEENGEEEMPLMDGEVTRAQEGVGEGELRAYAHRDIKPGISPLPSCDPSKSLLTSHLGNIMVDDDGHTPVLMDLGSLAPSPIPITSRSSALAVQDTAAEHSTMPYRAPELFDVKTGSVIDTKVDIWSLGCTLYACLVGKSPFEARSEETGGSLSICVLGGDWRFPDEGGKKGKAKQAPAPAPATTNNPNGGVAAEGGTGISESVREVVRACLQVEPAERPDVDQLIAMIETCVDALPDDSESLDS